MFVNSVRTRSPNFSVLISSRLDSGFERSGVEKPFEKTLCIACQTFLLSSSMLKLISSIIATEPIIEYGLAIPLPAMSGADPCEGS